MDFKIKWDDAELMRFGIRTGSHAVVSCVRRYIGAVSCTAVQLLASQNRTSLHSSSISLCLVPCALCLVPCALCLVPCALCLEQIIYSQTLRNSDRRKMFILWDNDSERHRGYVVISKSLLYFVFQNGKTF